jgi:hypothetical protein
MCRGGPPEKAPVGGVSGWGRHPRTWPPGSPITPAASRAPSKRPLWRWLASHQGAPPKPPHRQRISEDERSQDVDCHFTALQAASPGAVHSTGAAIRCLMTWPQQYRNSRWACSRSHRKLISIGPVLAADALGEGERQSASGGPVREQEAGKARASRCPKARTTKQRKSMMPVSRWRSQSLASPNLFTGGIPAADRDRFGSCMPKPVRARFAPVISLATDSPS